MPEVAISLGGGGGGAAIEFYCGLVCLLGGDAAIYSSAAMGNH